MATTMTLLQLRTAIRQRSNMENATGVYTDSFIKDPELTSYINQSAFELYDILIQKFGSDYFVADPHDIVTDGTNDTFSLNADFYKLIGVAVFFNNVWVPLKQGSVAEMMNMSGVNYPRGIGPSSMLYRIRANKLWLSPLPQSGLTTRLLYVPRMTQLSADSDTFDGISGWTEYVILDGVIKCLLKEETDVSVHLLQKDALLKRIESASANRDAANPGRVVDSQRVSDNDENWWGW
jgi:hypothetical protein